MGFWFAATIARPRTSYQVLMTVAILTSLFIGWVDGREDPDESRGQDHDESN
jgi:hypothetical protein